MRDVLDPWVLWVFGALPFALGPLLALAAWLACKACRKGWTMTKRCVIGLLAVLVAVPALAQPTNYLANVQLTIDSTAAGVGFTASDLAQGNGHPQINSASCVSNTDGGDFRFRVDGTAPTTSVGVLVPAGGALIFNSPLSLIAFKAIRTAGTSAVLSCTLSSAPAVPVFPVGAGGGGVGVVVTQGTDPWIVAGSFANDGVAAGSNRVPVLPCITLTAAPTWTNGRNSACRTFAGGGIGIVLTNAAGVEYELGTDPCANVAGLTTLPISAAADAVLITATASQRTYICDGAILANAAEIFAIWEGTGSTCGTSTAALVGSTTIGNGVSLAANGGFPLRLIRGISTNVDVCLHLNTTNRVTGYITYVKAP